MKVKAAFAIALALLCVNVSRAATYSGVCPATVAVRQELSAPVPGWTSGFNEAPHVLAAVTFFEGPPKENASLVYDSYRKLPASELATWRFDPAALRSAGRSIWIVCGFSRTSVTLAKSLPRNTVECSVTYDRNMRTGEGFAIAAVRCKER